VAARPARTHLQRSTEGGPYTRVGAHHAEGACGNDGGRPTIDAVLRPQAMRAKRCRELASSLVRSAAHARWRDAQPLQRRTHAGGHAGGAMFITERTHNGLYGTVPSQLERLLKWLSAFEMVSCSIVSRRPSLAVFLAHRWYSSSSHSLTKTGNAGGTPAGAAEPDPSEASTEAASRAHADG
jgi:hypothetical protein